ncbi:alpha/beta hydrolase family protein [Halalkalibacter urbisdiaboli]|uniref:alpha/beta hydrolase family protein n=1 Tax=Halalkalibacter urbisdiaboli TaxID=1960589 RepID=UPI000B440779|nr:prolyl oligopeptidase family serine peptidase [Halalkalibacter urbisdiaboli]
MNSEILHTERVPSPHPRVSLFIVTYKSEGLRVKGYLAIPQLDNASLPGLLYLRGGIKKVGMVRIQRVIQWASQGFIVMAPFYRGNLGGEGQEDFCGEDRMDAVYAFDLLKAHPNVKQHQIHVVGFSRGGVMALLTALERREVASVTSWNGVSDMFLTYEERVDLRRMMKRVIGSPAKYPERYEWRTPLLHLDQLNSPVLIIHGKKDEHVSVEHALRLKRALREHNKSFNTWIYPQFSHQFPVKDQLYVLQQAAKWMKAQIK